MQKNKSVFEDLFHFSRALVLLPFVLVILFWLGIFVYGLLSR